MIEFEPVPSWQFHEAVEAFARSPFVSVELRGELSMSHVEELRAALEPRPAWPVVITMDLQGGCERAALRIIEVVQAAERDRAMVVVHLLAALDGAAYAAHCTRRIFATEFAQYPDDAPAIHCHRAGNDESETLSHAFDLIERELNGAM